MTLNLPLDDYSSSFNDPLPINFGTSVYILRLHIPCGYPLFLGVVALQCGKHAHDHHGHILGVYLCMRAEFSLVPSPSFLAELQLAAIPVGSTQGMT